MDKRSSSTTSCRPLLTLVLLVVISSTTYLHFSSPDNPSTSSPPYRPSPEDVAFFEARVRAQSAERPFGRPTEPGWRYCEVDDIVRGTWVGGRTFGNVSDVWEAYGLKPNADTKCEPYPPLASPDQTPTSIEERTFDRIRDVASPRLEPVGGCRMLEIERRAVFKRLLRSSGGLTIVGDSMSQYTFQIWHDMLAVVPGVIVKTKRSSTHQTLSIKPDSKVGAALAEEAGVPLERLDHPLVSFFRDDQLLTEAELKTVMVAAGDRVDVKVNKDEDHWFDTWVQGLKNSSRVRVNHGKDETSLIVLNTGAFWSTKSLGSKIKEDDVDVGYQNMFHLMKSKIRELPYPIASYWRSLAPAHLDCAASQEVNNTQTDWASPISGALNSWNYHWYERMNGIAEGNTVHYRPSTAWNFNGIRALRDINPPLRFIDVWEMTIKRPDAHLKPPQDCLHLCMVGVMNYWQQLLWNVIAQESSNSDYDERIDL